MSKASAPFWAATLIVLLFGASVRLYKLDSYPIGFNQDQMVLGYDAWSIWQTGRDHHGQALPLFFRTFDDYVSPVANYLTSPFVGLLGLNEFNTRLPIAILGALTVLLVALLGREWFGPGARRSSDLRRHSTASQRLWLDFGPDVRGVPTVGWQHVPYRSRCSRQHMQL